MATVIELGHSFGDIEHKRQKCDICLTVWEIDSPDDLGRWFRSEYSDQLRVMVTCPNCATQSSTFVAGPRAIEDL